jgi:hypothetical protein
VAAQSAAVQRSPPSRCAEPGELATLVQLLPGALQSPLRAHPQFPEVRGALASERLAFASQRRRDTGSTAMKKLRIVILGFGATENGP